MTHGTRSAYVRGCRCDLCTTANRVYTREYLARLRSRPIPPDAHGKRSTYSNYGCRCDEWEFVTTLIGQDWLDERYPEPPGSWEFRDPTREKSDEEMARIEAARVEARLTA